MIPLVTRLEDDPEYVAIVTRIVRNLLRTLCPDELFLVQIDGWFGPKWLRFSGKTVGAAGVWESQLTLPPFHPHRVIVETHGFVVNCETGQIVVQPIHPLHSPRPSGENLHNKIVHISRSGLFVWYSSHTKVTSRASLMMYASIADEQFVWYASFHRRKDWEVTQLKNVSKQGILVLMREDDV